MQVVISSFDSDFFQLIDDRVRVFRYRGDKSVLWTKQTVEEKFDLQPSQYADYKSLVGDTADNIKGAEKVGPKTAATLLKEYQTLENILQILLIEMKLGKLLLVYHLSWMALKAPAFQWQKSLQKN